MRLQRRAESEDAGVVAAIFAVSLVALFGMSALAIDVGDIYATRRNLVTGTDAAALAAAQDYAFGGDGCASTDDTYLANNIVDASVEDCVHISNSSTSGYVTVRSASTVDHYFAPAIGVNSSDVHATSAAVYGPPLSYVGLRPLGLCAQSPAFMAWDASNYSTTQVFTIEYGSDDQPADCGGAMVPGHWGVIDFDGGANSNRDTTEWIADGYPNEIVVPGWYQGDTGSFSNGVHPESVVGRTIQVPVFDDWNGIPGGLAEFHLIGVASVEVIAVSTKGTQFERYIQVRFVTDVVLQGKCCGSGGIPAGSVFALCKFETYESDCTP